MDQGTLVAGQIEAGSEFLSRLANSLRVEACFWLKASVDGKWYLYVASGDLTATPLNVAYGAVSQVAQTMPEPKIDPFQVKLVRMENPVTRAVMEFQRHHTLKVPTRYPGRQLGDLSIEEAYIYPLPATVASP